MKPGVTSPAERWVCDAGSDSVAVLDIPGALGRRRVFDVDVSLTVRVPPDADGAWHELVVEVDGRRQWARRIPSHNPGQTDSLDYHCRLALEAGPALRVRAVSATRGCSVLRLLVEAQEERQ